MHRYNVESLYSRCLYRDKARSDHILFSIDTHDVSADSNFVFTELKVLKEVGDDKVLSVVTDNGSEMTSHNANRTSDKFILLKKPK